MTLVRLSTSLAVLVCVVVVGCRPSYPSYPRVADDDDSILLETPFTSGAGALNHNGTAFDRLEIDIGNHQVIWIAANDDVQTHIDYDGEKGRLRIEIEKRWMDASHTDKGSDVREMRKLIEARIATIRDETVVTVTPGWAFIEVGMVVTARFHVPAGIQVKRGEPTRENKNESLDWKVIPQSPMPVPRNRR